jgi:AbiV family abortive infection protein
MSMPDLSASLNAKPFKGKLFPLQASQAIDAARRTADDLLRSAEVRFDQGRFAHCVALSVLAMEEAGKRHIIMGMLLGWDEPASGWRDYVRHAAKTQFVNDAIAMQLRNVFPQIPGHSAEEIGAAGPDPEVLEKTKQRAFYSDCLDEKGSLRIHDPTAIDWKSIANYVICDARIIVGTLRHYSSTELSIWLRHAKLCQKEHRGLETGLAALEKDLREAGFIEPGWWKNILSSDHPTG